MFKDDTMHKYNIYITRLLVKYIENNLFVEIAPVYDSTGSYQATGGALSSNDIRRFIDTNSYSTQHYAFLTGGDGGGAIGIAYLGTCCFRNSNGKF